jgi:hypothetical protein
MPDEREAMDGNQIDQESREYEAHQNAEHESRLGEEAAAEWTGAELKARVCACGHTAYWHGSPNGTGSCEDGFDCSCEAFQPSTDVLGQHLGDARFAQAAGQEAAIQDAVMKYAAATWVEKHRRVSGLDFEAGWLASAEFSKSTREAAERTIEGLSVRLNDAENDREAAEREAERLGEALAKIIEAHDEEAGIAFGDDLEAEVLSIARAALSLRERITHGRHCVCSACAAEDWTNPNLAPCGMHGPSCPPVYAPIPREDAWTASDRRLTKAEGREGRLRWRRDHDYDPARVYVSEPFDIIWDPAGRTEDEDGGWWLESDHEVLGIFPTLREAKAAAEVAHVAQDHSVSPREDT